MPSAFSRLYRSLAAPVLSVHLAEDAGAVVRYPRGEEEGVAISRGIFTLDTASDDTSRGHENVRKGTLTIFDTTLDLGGEDLYEINGETWVTRAIHRGSDPWLDVDLERSDKEIGHGQGERKIL